MRKLVGITIAIAAMAIGPASAQDRVEGAAPAAGLSISTDPLIQVYRFSGVRDDGGANLAGTATSFHCTNFSGVTESFRVQVRNFGGTIVGDNTTTIGHNATVTTSTHGTNAYFEDVALNTGLVNQGSARIWASSPSIVCTASTVDAAAAAPAGIALQGIRFNPIPGTEY